MMGTCSYVLLGAWMLFFFAQQARGQEQDTFEAMKFLVSKLSPPEILKEMLSTDNTSQCAQDLTSLAHSTQNVSVDEYQLHVNTLLMVLDAFGKPDSGILQGDFSIAAPTMNVCLSSLPRTPISLCSIAQGR